MRWRLICRVYFSNSTVWPRSGSCWALKIVKRDLYRYCLFICVTAHSLSNCLSWKIQKYNLLWPHCNWSVSFLPLFLHVFICSWQQLLQHQHSLDTANFWKPSKTLRQVLVMNVLSLNQFQKFVFVLCLFLLYFVIWIKLSKVPKTLKHWMNVLYGTYIQCFQMKELKGQGIHSECWTEHCHNNAC